MGQVPAIYCFDSSLSLVAYVWRVLELVQGPRSWASLTDLLEYTISDSLVPSLAADLGLYQGVFISDGHEGLLLEVDLMVTPSLPRSFSQGSRRRLASASSGVSAGTALALLISL